jgi:hypothetical protein
MITATIRAMEKCFILVFKDDKEFELSILMSAGSSREEI